MIKLKKIFYSISINLILILSYFTSPSLGVNPEIYMPEPESVPGFNLLWNSTAMISNPFNESAPQVGAAAQIWMKNNTEDELTAVVGAVVVAFDDNPFSKKVPNYILTIAENIPGLSIEGDTYWDLLVSCINALTANVEEVTDIIKTTDQSLAFNSGESDYFILSKDGETLIFSFAFSINDEWRDYVINNEDELGELFNAMIMLITGFLGFWDLVSDAIELAGYFLPISASIGVPSASAYSPPSGTSTAESDVQAVTKGIAGYIYNGPNIFDVIIPAVVIGFFFIGVIIYFILRRRDIRNENTDNELREMLENP